ncbi:MAG: AarF/UbiB family protein [Solirubrobacteraceae bacterium]|nr:AarF/UbiB family protein [Patulibacter sp.]
MAEGTAPSGAATPPPLPSLPPLIRSSQRLAAFPGLTEQALRWHEEAIGRRKVVTRDAKSLATPRLWHDTVASLASTGWRMATAAAPDAPFQLLAAAAAAVGLRVQAPTASQDTLDRAQRLVRAGGPAYVKLGQFIASANGLLPDEWVEAFAWCRDEAPPLRPGVAQSIIDRELTGDLRARLAWLDDEPLAAGSIGQVHRGRLDDGTEVVVKVRRPKLLRKFRADIETLALASAAAEKLHPAARSANLSGFVELFAELSLAELDFRLEAANLVDSTAVLESLGAEHMHAPRPIPGMVTERLLVMEFLPGASYARIALPEREAGERLLYEGIKGVLDATLLHGIFHGDLHAGNVLITDDDRFSLVDFGIAGRLDAKQRAGLVHFLAAFAANDARGQIEAMKTFGAIDHKADIDTLVKELQVEMDRLEHRDRGQVTFDQLGITLGRLLQVLARNGFRMPTDLVLFFKNLLYLGSFAASVAPDADVLAVVQRILLEMLANPESGLAELLGQDAPPAA